MADLNTSTGELAQTDEDIAKLTDRSWTRIYPQNF